MNPRLTAIAGRLKGSVFAIDDLPVVIGRETAATLCVADASISRRHSQIEKDADHFVILDLDSLNGTFINDVPVKRRVLKHGDRVRIGDSQFLFLVGDGDAAPQSNEVKFSDEKVVSGSTLQVRFNDAAFLMARDLSALMKVATTINAIRGIDELQKTLLDLLFEVVPAERGVVMLTDGHFQGADTQFSSILGLDRKRGPDQSIRVSRTVTRAVLSQGEAVLISKPEDADDFKTPSFTEDLPTSALCVPLIMLDRTLGVIYLDTREPDATFDKDHLQLVSAIAAISAVAIENARHIEYLVDENRRLIADFNVEHSMVGESEPVREVLQFISKVAPTDSTVLLTGESGTGKELAARAIHQNSKRASKPFMAVNCAALAESLLESELFGHERGSFTGALVQKKGRLEVADEGTVFLDEIGELSASMQVKLLRVLQEREFERVGGTRSIKVNLRLIAAPNRNLEEAVKQGTFRQDLYYRLNVVSLEMPALRRRREDILLLANYFLARYGERCNRRVAGISAEAQEALLAYDWPGNIRELENTIERAVVLGTTDRILLEDLPESVLEAEPVDVATPTKYHEAVTQTKRQIILNAMEQAHGSYTAAAKLLGVHPNYLHRLIRNLNLKELVKK